MSPQHHDPQIEVAISIVVDGIPEDSEEDAEEDAEVVEEDHSQLEPLWLRRGQMHLGRICSKIQMLPQCPVLILREQDRETSWALSWTAQTAEGVVGPPVAP